MGGPRRQVGPGARGGDPLVQVVLVVRVLLDERVGRGEDDPRAVRGDDRPSPGSAGALRRVGRQAVEVDELQQWTGRPSTGRRGCRRPRAGAGPSCSPRGSGRRARRRRSRCRMGRPVPRERGTARRSRRRPSRRRRCSTRRTRGRHRLMRRHTWSRTGSAARPGSGWRSCRSGLHPRRGRWPVPRARATRSPPRRARAQSPRLVSR